MWSRPPVGRWFSADIRSRSPQAVQFAARLGRRACVRGARQCLELAEVDRISGSSLGVRRGRRARRGTHSSHRLDHIRRSDRQDHRRARRHERCAARQSGHGRLEAHRRADAGAGEGHGRDEDERWAVLAQHNATGQLVGLTGSVLESGAARNVGQGNTGVRPRTSRSRARKWLKARCSSGSSNERPYLKDIRTGNADSNGRDARHQPTARVQAVHRGCGLADPGREAAGLPRRFEQTEWTPSRSGPRRRSSGTARRGTGLGLIGVVRTAGVT